MLQGAVLAVLISAVVGGLGYAGLAGPAAAHAAGAFLLVGGVLLIAFLVTARLRRRPRLRKEARAHR